MEMWRSRTRWKNSSARLRRHRARVAAIEQQASTVAAGGDYDLAYRIVHTATDLLTIMHDRALQARLDEASVAYGWEVGRRLVRAGGAPARS